MEEKILLHRILMMYVSSLILVLCILIFSGCDKEHDEVELSNPFDPMNPETHGVHVRIDINNGAPESNDRNITLSLYSAYSTVASELRISNVNSFTGSWQAYKSSMDWTLSDGDGTKTVYVQIRDAVGNVSDTASASILLEELPDTIMGKDGALMMLVPAGEFQMGDHFNEGADDELPVHTVYLDAFYIDKYEVTNALYKNFMDATGHKAPGYWNNSKYNAPDQPVVGVSWEDAKAYAEWAEKRLPTEAQWEKAARGGLAGKKFPWGDSDPDGSQCNFADKNTDYDWSDKDVDDGYQYSAPVGSSTPNGYGLYDMAGNVWEWCSDWYDKSYYTNSPKNNPTGPDSGTVRVVRGGCWYNSPYYLRVALRYYSTPSNSYFDIGFRCVSQD